MGFSPHKMSLSECAWYISEINCDNLRKSINELLAYIEDESFKNDEDLKEAINGITLPAGLEIVYEDVKDFYEKEQKQKK